LPPVVATMGAGVVIACGCPTSLNVTVTVTLEVVFRYPV